MKNILLLYLLIFALLSSSCAGKIGDQGKTEQDTEQSVPFDFPDLQPPVFKDQTFDIRDYGAKPGGDTTFLNTEAIKSTIKACNQAGGGKVLVPAGVWLTGPVHLMSNVNLHLEDRAELRFSKNFDDYLPVVLIQRGGIFCYNYSPPLYANECENIAVTGNGTLNGQGEAWWPWKKRQPGMVELFEKGKSGVPVEERVFGTEEAGVRPPFIHFLNCKNVFMQGVLVKDGPSWNVHPVLCENVIIKEIEIDALGPNNDGINPDYCKNVLIEDCLLNTGDDAITLKSGRDEEAWEIARPLENVVVRRCTVLIGGGIAIGSEMSAGIKNVLVENCHFSGSGLGLHFKSRIGRRGVVENFWARNITMENIKRGAINIDLRYDGEPIERDMNYERRNVNLKDAPVFRNFHFENISCENAGAAIFLRGLPGDYLKELHFKDIHITAKTGLVSSDVNDVYMDNVEIISIK